MTETTVEFRAPVAAPTDRASLHASLIEAMPGMLEAAARLVERSGWVQGWHRREDRYCAFGAILEASGYVRWDRCHCPDGDYAAEIPPGMDALLLRMAHTAMGLPESISVPAWNDAAGRTAAEVVNRLRMAADVACGWSE